LIKGEWGDENWEKKMGELRGGIRGGDGGKFEGKEVRG